MRRHLGVRQSQSTSLHEGRALSRYRQNSLWVAFAHPCLKYDLVVPSVEFQSPYRDFRFSDATIWVFCPLQNIVFNFRYFSSRRLAFCRLYRTNTCLYLLNKSSSDRPRILFILNVSFRASVRVWYLFARHPRILGLAFG